MSEDPREAQSKYDRSAAATTGLPGPALPATPTDAAPPASTVPGRPAAAAPPTGPAGSADERVPAPSAVPVPAGPARSAGCSPAARAPVTAGSVDGTGAASDVDDDTNAAYDEPDLPLSPADRLRRLSPALVTLGIGSLGSLILLALAVTSHTTPVAILLGAGVVTALVFGLDAVIASVATYRRSQDGETGRAVLLALVGGIAAVICASALAGSLIMVLALNG